MHNKIIKYMLATILLNICWPTINLGVELELSGRWR